MKGSRDPQAATVSNSMSVRKRGVEFFWTKNAKNLKLKEVYRSTNQ